MTPMHPFSWGTLDVLGVRHWARSWDRQMNQTEDWHAGKYQPAYECGAEEWERSQHLTIVEEKRIWTGVCRQTRFYQRENMGLENLCTEFVFIVGHEKQNWFGAGRAWGLLQHIKGRYVGFLLLCDKRPPTRRLEPAAHTNYLTVFVSQNCAQLCLVLSPPGTNSIDWGWHPIWSLKRENCFPVHSGGWQSSFPNESRTKLQIPTGGSWRLP